jgi:hypothetical protein
LQINTPIPPPFIDFKPGCGHRNAKGVAGFQITGAVEGDSEYGEFPWTVMIFVQTEELDLKTGSL